MSSFEWPSAYGGCTPKPVVGMASFLAARLSATGRPSIRKNGSLLIAWVEPLVVKARPHPWRVGVPVAATCTIEGGRDPRARQRRALRAPALRVVAPRATP